ncbi:MAG: restriction endonuclease subunit S [Alistipes onderdonkii]
MDTKKLRQKILDLAIHGKLVPQDPTDEPASVLLERIKAEKERLIKEGKIKRSKKSAKTSDTPHYENVPFEVPDGWKSVPVSELFCLNPKSEITDDTSVGFIPMACVNDGFSGNHQFEKRIWKEVKKGYCHFQNGDIGIAKISPCFENLKSTIFQNLPNNYGAGTTELVILRPLNIHAKFYLYLFKSQWYISEGTKYFKGVVGQQRVHKGIFTDLQIPLPPLTEQYRIVAEIEKWFALIDQIEQGKADLQTAIKQTKSKILDLSIHGKLVPQDPNDEPAIELLKRIHPDFIPCDNGHYPQLPDGWCYSTIKEVFIINPRNKVDDDVEVGFVPMANITDGYNNTFKYEKKRWGKIKTGFTHFADGDIAVAKISPCLENRKSVVLKGLPNGIGAGTTELHVFRSQFIDTQYGLYFFKSDYFISQCIGSFNGVVGQQRVSKNIIEDIIIAIPPINEQKRIVYTVRKIFAQLDIIMGSL